MYKGFEQFDTANVHGRLAIISTISFAESSMLLNFCWSVVGVGALWVPAIEQVSLCQVAFCFKLGRASRPTQWSLELTMSKGGVTATLVWLGQSDLSLQEYEVIVGSGRHLDGINRTIGNSMWLSENTYLIRWLSLREMPHWTFQQLNFQGIFSAVFGSQACLEVLEQYTV